MRFLRAIYLLACASVLAGAAFGETADSPRDAVLTAAQRICSEGLDAAPSRRAELLSEGPVRGRGVVGLKRTWRIGEQTEIRVVRLNRIDRGGTLYFVDYYQIISGVARPLVRAVVTDQCKILGGRQVEYGPIGDKPEGPLSITPLSSDLRETGKSIPLNPAVPAGEIRDDCVRVGLLDNGVNYLLPRISDVLARDHEGQLIGYDYWEEDQRPFDYGVPPTEDPRISMFSPRHHGTSVASVFIQGDKTGSACLAPYRYQPILSGDKISRIISDMAKDGVRVVSLSSGRNDPWPEFQAAMRDHPEILFVLAAGNNGADLSERPYFPAAYGAENAIVVAASNDLGNLWARSNKGKIVDVAIDAVNVLGFDVTGRAKKLTGTSFASPKVAALAAQLLSENPRLSATQVKSRLIASARDSGVEADGIPVLTEDIVTP